jgi:Mce-associated membrane protein
MVEPETKTMKPEEDPAIDADDKAPDDDGVSEASKDDETTSSKAVSRRVSLSLRTLVVAGVFMLLVAAVGVMAWLYVGERGKVAAQQQRAADYQRAEQVALDYAVNAAAMNFQDLNAWKGKLVEGTTPALTDKLTKAASQMEQLLVPLEWSSTAQPLVAKVRSDANGVYVVDTFVSVLTKTTQAPDNLQSTATYSITIDSNDNWLISDVGGIGAVVGPR